MDYFGYKFIGKTPELDASRRISLDRHARIAQLSQLLSIITIPCIKFAVAFLINLLHNGVEKRHTVPAGRERASTLNVSSQEGKALRLSRAVRDIALLLDSEVMSGYGTYEQWMFRLGWAFWLGFLCINDTAPGT